jgi:glycosyltransferase involved in cell wall biosynthesis
MVRTPIVSVIIPNYNHAPFLEQRFDSVLNQTFQDFEVIILDDYSTDNSNSIIEKYGSHPKVSHVIYNSINTGSPFKQWDKGIQLAKGEYIWIAESDDWCEKTFLEELVKGIKQEKNTNLAYCQTFFVDTNENILRRGEHPKLSEIVEGHDYIFTYLYQHNNIFNASLVLFRRSGYENLSKDYTEFKYCGDWLLWIRLASLGQVYISGKLLNYYRQHAHNTIHKGIMSSDIFYEKIRILSVLNDEFQLPKKKYLQNLLARYRDFRNYRKHYTPNTIQELKTLFFTKTHYNPQFFLRYNYVKLRVKSLKNRVIRKLVFTQTKILIKIETAFSLH